MTIAVAPRALAGLSERIDHSLLSLHALAGLDAGALARIIGVPTAVLRAAYFLERGSSVRSSLARIRVEEAERLLRAASASLPAPSVIGWTAEAVGFRSSDEMDRAFLRLRRRSSFDVLTAFRVVQRSVAA